MHGLPFPSIGGPGITRAPATICASCVWHVVDALVAHSGVRRESPAPVLSIIARPVPE